MIKQDSYIFFFRKVVLQKLIFLILIRSKKENANAGIQMKNLLICDGLV